jgi:hypothetical protein
MAPRGCRAPVSRFLPPVSAPVRQNPGRATAMGLGLTQIVVGDNILRAGRGHKKNNSQQGRSGGTSMPRCPILALSIILAASRGDAPPSIRGSVLT